VTTSDQTTRQFAGQVVIVTGAGSGIGRATAAAFLKESRGAIVNVSSTFGHRPAAGAGHYGASKAALEQLTSATPASTPPPAKTTSADVPSYAGPTSASPRVQPVVTLGSVPRG
jgi:NAD(P)-dependent dehydrogenase (short-subunit alcohol dehydrogenase family)